MAAAQDEKCPIHDIFCPVHADVQGSIRRIQDKQESRHCGAHEAMLHSTQRDIAEIKCDNDEQWVAINQLRRWVYVGMGGVSVAAFFGSIVGQMIISHFKR